MGVGAVLRHHVLRRSRPLRLPQRGVRPVLPRQRPAARHVPERDPIRGGDHRHDPRSAARRSHHRVRTGRTGLLGWHRQHLSRAPGLPRPRRGHPGHRAAQRHQARDRPPRLRQGLPPVRHRAAGRTGRPGHHDRSTPTGWPKRSTTERSPSSARRATTDTAPWTRSRPCRTSRSSAASACTSTAASVAGSCRSDRSSATTSPSSTSGSRGSRRSRRTPTSTDTR